METITVDGKVYRVDVIPFEDKDERDVDGFYNYFYKGVHLLFHSDKEIIKAKIYDGEEVISFYENPLITFQKDFEAIKIYLRKRFGVKKVKFLGGEMMGLYFCYT